MIEEFFNLFKKKIKIFQFFKTTSKNPKSKIQNGNVIKEYVPPCLN